MSVTFVARGAIAAMLLSSTAAVAGDIVGTVIDASGTRVLQGTEVRILENGRTATVDRDGTFRFVDLAAGTYTLEAVYAGSEPLRRQVVVPATGDVRVDLRVGDEGSDILVIGQVANLASSISRQRSADGVSTVLTRDAIGQFPDQNVAEALRRAPGINVLNDQGEGRFVSVRGLDPNLNSTSINGNRVLATGGDERAAALDVIPSELVESIEIKKTLTPDMDADTLGGSIEINTTSAFNRKRGFLSVTGEGSYSQLQDAWSPKFGIDFSTRLGENFGVSGGASYHRRIFGSDNIEANGWETTDAGVTYAPELDYRDYDVTRERIGASLSFDARVGSTTTLYLRGLYSRFDDLEFRRRLIFRLPPPTDGDADTARFVSGSGGANRVEIRRDFKDRQEVQTISTVSAGGRTETGPWRFTYDASWSMARQDEDGSVDPIRFRQRFESGASGLGLTFDYSDLGLPRYNVDFGGARFFDATRYLPSLLERTTDESARDREYALRGDAGYEIPLDMGTLTAQGGVRARFRHKSLDFTIDVFDGFPTDLRLSTVVGPQTYDLALIDPVPGAREWRDYLSRVNFAGFRRNAVDSDFASSAEDYEAREDILAGYGLLRLDTADLRVIGGVRMERTRNRFDANRLDLNTDTGILTVTPVGFRRNYTDWMPSLNARFEAGRNVVLRGGVYRSLVRPGLANVAPRFIIEEDEDGERTGTFGNPDLSPYRAWNADLSAEYYFARNAVVQGGVFWKSIGNFIVTGRFDDVTFNGITVDEGTIPINGETARVKGFEFAYQQALDFLPGALGGLLVNFNYTYTDASGRLADAGLTTGRRIPLPASSKHTFNAVLGYERDAVSLRLAGAYRSGYLDEIGGDALEDRFVKQHFQFDVSAKYQITRNIRLFAEWVNVFDEPYVAFQRGPDRDRLLQFEEYGWTAKFGARVNF